ncbi:MAG: hypothetical protein LBT86_07510 [Deltaproteobacteria bacterium]|jgi:hypothetical protein|nr:hypothetical protein [Deltaproteobacteria bacterium]
MKSSGVAHNLEFGLDNPSSPDFRLEKAPKKKAIINRAIFLATPYRDAQPTPLVEAARSLAGLAILALKSPPAEVDPGAGLATPRDLTSPARLALTRPELARIELTRPELLSPTDNDQVNDNNNDHGNDQREGASVSSNQQVPRAPSDLIITLDRPRFYPSEETWIDEPLGSSQFEADSLAETDLASLENGPLIVRSWVWIVGFCLLSLAVAWGAIRSLPDQTPPLAPLQVEADITPLPPLAPGFTPPLGKKDVASLMGARVIDEANPRVLAIQSPVGEKFFLETTLDPPLQTQANEWLKKTRASQAALVVMNPLDGQVLALASYRRDGEPLNAAITEPVPAASLFKIVTATAALEKADYQADSEVSYDGGKHTLYRGNVIKRPDVGRHKTTLKEGFAESNNTVFGKLGAFDLEPQDLATYATRFYFNQNIDFEMKVAVSPFQLDRGDEEALFRLAELASGFNRQTKTTALHGALLPAAVISGGTLMEPTMIREVFDRDNQILYQSTPKSLGRVMAENTAQELAELMEAAVIQGTGRRHFADVESHPLLSGVVIGGKSGTINDEAGRRVEWFVAYSYWPEPGAGPVWPLALAAVVVNEGKVAPDSQELIRRALIAYYQPLLDGTGRVYK